MQGRHPSFDTLDLALDVQGRLLGLAALNEEMLRKSAPGGKWASPEAHAYCRLLARKLGPLVSDGQRLCEALNTTATAAHAHSTWKETVHR